MRRTRRRTRVGLALVGLAVLLAGCIGYTSPPTNVTQTGATFHASVSCTGTDSTTPCNAWFQYWQDGDTTIRSTSRVTATANVTNFDFQQSVTNLAPGTLYHYELCGYGDGDEQPPGLCVSPHAPGGYFADPHAPLQQPDAGNLSATQNFRTAGPGSVATIDLGRVLSTADTRSYPISRDGGTSVSYAPGKALWVFGDTTGLLFDGTAIAGSFTPGTAPTGLDELPTPNAPPQPGRTRPANFFPAPVGLKNGSSSCSSAAWVSGAAREPGTSKVLLVYGQICLSAPFGMQERTTLIEYDPATNAFGASYVPFDSSASGVALPFEQQFGAPVFGSDGYVYFFGGLHTGSGLSVVRVLAANHALWGQASSYQWWAQPSGRPLGWYGVADSASAQSVLPAGLSQQGVTVNDYSSTTDHHLVAVVQLHRSPGQFQLYEATSPTGPWTPGPATTIPDACPGPETDHLACYSVVGHPELSTNDQFVYSWYSPDDLDNHGHIRIGTFAW